MAIIQNTPEPTQSEKTTDNVYVAQQGAPAKISNRPVEPVPGSSSSRVANQVNAVISQGGPLLSRAKAEGVNAAAERGLNNSSMGIQAAEDAVYKYALPIAQQDVDMDFKKEMQKDDQTFQSSENAANRSHQLAMQNSEFGFRSGESALDRQFNKEESLLNREHQLTSMEKDQAFSAAQNELSRNQQLQLQKGDQAFQAKEADADRLWRAEQQNNQNEFTATQQQSSHKYQLAEIKASADEQIRVAASQVDEKFRTQYLDTASSLQKSFLDQQTAILNNTNLKSAQITNALSVAEKGFSSSMAWLQGLYNQGGPNINIGSFPATAQVGNPRGYVY